MRIKTKTFNIISICLIGLLIILFAHFYSKVPKSTVPETATERFQNARPNDTYRIIVDTQTGINYLVYEAGIGQSKRLGLTPLLDADGNTVKTKIVENNS